MADKFGATIHSITDGRLTLKKPHLDFLGNPETVTLTYGPGTSVLIHNPDKHDALVEQLLGDVAGALDGDQYFVAKRLDDVAETAAVDEQGRLRLPTPFLNRAELKDKTCKAYLVPAKHDKWLELQNEVEYDRAMNDPKDPWREALDRLITKWRERQAG